MYVIVQFPEDTKEVKIAVTTNHFDAGYQYNLLAMEDGQHAFLFEVDESVSASLSLDPDKFDFETLPGATVLAINGESYSGHEDYDKEETEAELNGFETQKEFEEPPCTCETGRPYNLTCKQHGETGETLGI